MKKEDMFKSVKIFGVSYALKIVYKRIKNPKLDLKERQIEISLPIKYKKIENDIIIEILLQKMYDAIANKELEVIMEKVRTTLKFAPDDYKIMRLDKRLGKCLANKLIINPDIVKYRKDIIEYVVFYDIEFKDTNNNYRHWKSYFDGGKLILVGEEVNDNE